MQNALKNAQTSSVTLPHNLSFGLSSLVLPTLCVAAEVHLTLWQDFGTIKLTVKDMPPGTGMTTLPLVLNWQTSVNVRVGAEYALLGGRLPLRLGVGWDQSPVPASTMSPLTPDADRIIVSGGLGFRHKWLYADAGYMAVILLSRTGQAATLDGVNAQYVASYSTVGHVIAINLAMRLEQVGLRVNVPEYKRQAYGL
jgi:long-subunit fatty acid transport protein